MTTSDAPAAGYGGEAVSLEAVLASRDRRVMRQAALLERHMVPVVSLTIVMPGPVKDNRWARRALQEAMVSFERLCEQKKWPVLARGHEWLASGPEALWAVDAGAATLKASTIELEDYLPIGRLWDFDVIGPGISAVSRKALGILPRPCLVCRSPARECGRSRRHSLNLLLATIEGMMEEYDGGTRD